MAESNIATKRILIACLGMQGDKRSSVLYYCWRLHLFSICPLLSPFKVYNTGDTHIFMNEKIQRMCESYHQKYMLYRYLTALSHSRLLWSHKNYRNQRNSGSLAPPTTENHKSVSSPKIIIILWFSENIRRTTV